MSVYEEKLTRVITTLQKAHTIERKLHTCIEKNKLGGRLVSK